MSSPSADPVDRVVEKDETMASVHDEEGEGDATMADNQGISDDSSEEPEEDEEEARSIREGFIVDEDEDEEEDEARARRGKRHKRRHQRIAQTASASETTPGPYDFSSSRSISPTSSTPPSSSSTSLTSPFQFTFPDGSIPQDRPEYNYRRQTTHGTDLTSHGGTADISNKPTN
ncbi:hypothetical protein M405DRAFT_930367 [Rhizopogon salebrosus TDB-379]|nr:hypothetical protein M405DRAFT_930367 [Rhizopogon salebrosus TDB-379]